MVGARFTADHPDKKNRSVQPWSDLSGLAATLPHSLHRWGVGEDDMLVKEEITKLIPCLIFWRIKLKNRVEEKCHAPCGLQIKAWVRVSDFFRLFDFWARIIEQKITEQWAVERFKTPSAVLIRAIVPASYQQGVWPAGKFRFSHW